jgi:hypothetical protein
MAVLTGRRGGVEELAQPRPRKLTMFHPWIGPAPDPLARPLDARALQVASARYVGGLFAVSILLQRFSTGVLPDVSILVPLSIFWMVWGALRGIVVVDRTRLALWLLAAGTSAFVVPLQLHFVTNPLISPTSYALFLVVWLPAVIRMKDNRRETYVMALRYIALGAVGLAAGCVVFMAVQLAGIGYIDVLAQVVPSRFLLQGFVITYPITFGSPLNRANAWIGLEPSIVSIMMAVGLVSGLLSGVRIRLLALILAGMVCATAGSGLAILLVAFLVMLGYPVRRNLVRYLPIAVAAAAALVVTPFGKAILNRVTEAGDSQSSTSLRGILPYAYLWPKWIADPWSVLLGRGPSSSQTLVQESGILGLLVPSPVKIFFEYGLIAGLCLAALLLYSYIGGPSRSLPVTLLVSLWVLQPGTTTLVIIIPVYLTSTWWAPRIDPVLESDSSTYSSARGLVERAARWRPLQGFRTWRLGRGPRGAAAAQDRQASGLGQVSHRPGGRVQ